MNHPTPTELRRASTVALELVNVARVEAGHTVADKWPIGFRSCANECPVSRLLAFSAVAAPMVNEGAISFTCAEDADAVARAWGRGVSSSGNTFEVVTPIAVRNFIRYFDRAFYKELIKPATGTVAYLGASIPLTERLREAVAG